MTYNQAKILVQNSNHLIGTINDRGFEVSDIIIVPSETSLRCQFIRLYMMCHDAGKTIQPFVDSDVEVWGIDTRHLFKANILFYDTIAK